jgi:hypothetical protein
MHNIAESRVATEQIRDYLTECPGIQPLIDAFNGIMNIFFGRRDSSFVVF